MEASGGISYLYNRTFTHSKPRIVSTNRGLCKTDLPHLPSPIAFPYFLSPLYPIKSYISKSKPEHFMKHFIIDANPDLIPYFEDLYEKQGYDFAMQYGMGDHYLLTTQQEAFYPLVLQQKGAREVVPSQMADTFINIEEALWLGNEALLWRMG